MFRNLVEQIPGNEIFALAALVIFFLIFIAVLVWAVRADKSYIKHMKNMPLEDEKDGENKDE